MTRQEENSARKTASAALKEQIQGALARIAEWEGPSPDAPAFVTATTKLCGAKTECKTRWVSCAR